MLPENEPDVEIESELDVPSQVIVDLDKKPDQKSVDPKTQPQPKPSEDISKLHNTIAYQTRQLEKAMREIQEVKEQVANSRKQEVKEPESQDEIDQLAQRDWKQGVTKLVEPAIEKRVEEILRKRDEAQADLARKNSLTEELEKSRQIVLQKYPEVEEQGSEMQKYYLQAINEDPSVLKNPRGPWIAMKRMEEIMEEKGAMPRSLKSFVDKEALRLARAGASSVIGRTVNSNGKVPLSKEQQKFCDINGVPYDRYAKNLKALANGEDK